MYILNSCCHRIICYIVYSFIVIIRPSLTTKSCNCFLDRWGGAGNDVIILTIHFWFTIDCDPRSWMISDHNHVWELITIENVLNSRGQYPNPRVQPLRERNFSHGISTMKRRQWFFEDVARMAKEKLLDEDQRCKSSSSEQHY